MIRNRVSNLLLKHTHTIAVDDPADKASVYLITIAFLFYEFEHSVCDLFM